MVFHFLKYVDDTFCGGERQIAHGRDGDHFGMFPVFVLGNVLSLPTGILLVSRLGPAVLSKHYALMTAPSCVPWNPLKALGQAMSQDSVDE